MDGDVVVVSSRRSFPVAFTRAGPKSTNTRRQKVLDIRPQGNPSALTDGTSQLPSKNTATRLMRGLPLVLVVEVRLAFQTCSRQHVASRKTQFSTFRPLLKKSPPRKKGEAPIQVVHNQLRAQKEVSVSKRGAQDSAAVKGQAARSKNLIPVQEEGRALQDGRKVEVPFKVIPRADITPNLTLSPKERLHIEQLTRNLPPRTEPKGRYVNAGLQMDKG